MSSKKALSSSAAVFVAAATLAQTSFGRSAQVGHLDHFNLDHAKELATEFVKKVGPKQQQFVTRTNTDCAQSVSGHRIDSLPYWQETTALPCMYSGHLLSSEDYENYFFYWLHPRPDSLAEGDNTDSPLIVYLNGGPGSTSMNALFTGNGPLRVTETESGVKGEDFEITYDTTISWAAAGDLLWIDQPVGTGWSYGEHMVTSLDEIGAEFLQFMLSFYEEYPIYKERQLVLTGESFAGKYLSYSSRAILDYNDSQDEFKFDLRNLMLSNPLVDTPTERLNQEKVGWALGLYDDFQTDQVETLKRRCEEGRSLSWDPASQATACKDILNYITKPIGTVDQMDVTHFGYEHYIDKYSFTDMFTTSDRLSELKKALHISKTEAFERTNSTVANAIEDRENNAAGVYTELLARGLHILINVGNYDMKDGVRSTLEWVKKVDFEGREMFDLQPRKVYKYLDQFDGSEKVGGWYRHHDNFTVIVVPQAGHMVPAFQPYASMQFVKNLIDKGYLTCETDANGSCKSVASSMCSYMNDCNGNGQCNSYGKCECDAGFFGADCLTQVVDLTKEASNAAEVTVNASRWFYYTIPESTGDFSLSVTSDRDVSVYIRKGATGDLPDTVNFDSLVRDDTQISVTSQLMNLSTGAIVAVHCVGETDDTTTFNVQLSQLEDLMVHNSYEFLDLAASAVPASAKPGFEGKEWEEETKGGEYISNLQFMILGALMGMLATVVYYQMARFCQQYRQGQSHRILNISDLESQRGAAANSLEDPNKYLFRTTKAFKEDSNLADKSLDEE